MKKNDFIFKKSLGQNFLHNKHVANKIAGIIDISNKNVIEIGCGNGFLTREIMSFNPKKLTIIELDERCIELASENLKNLDNFSKIEFININALDLKISEISKEKPAVISNLPYSVGSRIFVNLTEQSDNISEMVLMFQKEVAKRLIAKCNTENYGLLSVICQLFWNCKMKFDVSPNDFTPKPSVISSVLHFSQLENISTKNFQKNLEILKKIFSNRRKMLRVFAKDIVEKFPKHETKRSGELDLSDIQKILDSK